MAEPRPTAPAPLVRWRIRQWWYFALVPAALPLSAAAHLHRAGQVPSPPLSEQAALHLTALSEVLRLGFLGGLCASALLALGYYANGIADRHMDVSVAKNPMAGRAPPRAWRTELCSLLALALLLAAPSGGRAVAAAGVSAAFGLLYSLGPRLKGVPAIGSMVNVLYFAPMLLVAWPRSEPLPAATGTIATAFCGLLLSNQLLHEAADAREDLRGRLRTTYALLGPGRTALAAAAVGLLTVSIATRCLPRPAPLHGLQPASVALLACAAALPPLAIHRFPAGGARLRRARRLHRLASALACALVCIA